MITYFTPVSIVMVTVNLIHNSHHLPPYLERWLPYTHHFIQDQCDWDQEVAAFNSGHSSQEGKKMQNARSSL